jgi:hypothetical protein
LSSLDLIARSYRSSVRRVQSYLRTFALELKEQLALTLAALVTSILTKQRGRPSEDKATQPVLRQIIAVLQQVMCTHNAEKLAISLRNLGTRRLTPRTRLKDRSSVPRPKNLWDCIHKRACGELVSAPTLLAQLIPLYCGNAGF